MCVLDCVRVLTYVRGEMYKKNSLGFESIDDVIKATNRELTTIELWRFFRIVTALSSRYSMHDNLFLSWKSHWCTKCRFSYNYTIVPVNGVNLIVYI